VTDSSRPWLLLTLEIAIVLIAFAIGLIVGEAYL